MFSHYFETNADHGRRGAAMAITVIIFLVGLVVSVLTPPFQSPDEPDHLKRAFMFSEMQLVMQNQPAKSSGASVDSGLLQYASIFDGLKFRPDKKASQEDFDRAVQVEWSGRKSFSEAPGVGYYFPLIYAPQAVALRVGTLFNLKIDTTYYLARLLVLGSTCFVLYRAFLIRLPSLFLVALLLLPMSLFQMASTTIDGTSIALLIYVLSVWSVCMAQPEELTRLRLFFIFLALFALISSRLQALPVLALLLLLGYKSKRYAPVVAALLVAALVFWWMSFANSSVVDMRVINSWPRSEIAKYYFFHPYSLVSVLWKTFSTPSIALYYVGSFIGSLGWHDAKFDRSSYLFFAAFLALLFALSLQGRKPISGGVSWFGRSLLLLCAAASCFIVIFSLLIAWTPHPAVTVDGIQGRYFSLPAVMLAFALTRPLGFSAGSRVWRMRLDGFSLGAFLVYSVVATSTLLLQRYFLQSEFVELESNQLRTVNYSEVEGRIDLIFSRRLLLAPQNISGIDLLIDSGAAKRSSHGVLTLKSARGNSKSFEFEVPPGLKEKYVHINLDSDRYIGGWVTLKEFEGHVLGVESAGQVVACLLYTLPNGLKRFTPNCPSY